MKTMMQTTTTMIAAFALSAAGPAAAAEDDVATEGAKVGQWTMDYAAAVDLAEEKDLPLLLNFTGSDWCGWCKLMDKNVFSKEAWKEYAADNLVLVTLDFPQDKSIVPEKYVERNQQLQEKFGVRGYPTYLLLDSDGETKLGQLGAGQEKTPESFIKEVESIVKTRPSNVAAYIEANPDKAEAFKSAIADLESVKKELEEWIATGPERNEENSKIFAEFQERVAAAEQKLAEF